MYTHLSCFALQVHKYFCHYLAWLLCMNRSCHNLSWRSIRRQNWSSSVKQQDEMNNRSGEREEQPTNSTLNASTVPVLESQGLNNYQDSSNLLRSPNSDIIRSDLHSIVSQLTNLTQCIQQQESDREKSRDWQFLAMVIDRLCLILFIIFLIIFSIQAPISLWDIQK
jgi:hypothetical protein